MPRLSFIVLLFAGCSGDAVDRRTVDPTQQRLIALVRAYGRTAVTTEKAPRNFGELTFDLAESGSNQEHLKSARDGKFFVVLWGTRFVDREPKIYMFEAEGAGGRRWVALTDGSTREVTEEQFQALPKAK